MKKLLLGALLLPMGLWAQTPCESGMAGGFECEGYDLMSQVPLSTMNSVKANDSWGWTDPLDGKEYAIICLNEATAFIDISDPLSPIYLGQLPGNSPDHTTWRDAKTYQNHVYIVSEDSNHGMQVFDLTRLRDVANPPVIFDEDNIYENFGSCHNIYINEETGFAYAVGTSTYGGGAHIIDISDPANPVEAGGYPADGYTHDAQIVIYDGPDSDYTGQEIMFASNENEIVIVDVTDKSNMIQISTIDYVNYSYVHQGWLTEDHRYFLLGDETDELDFGFNSRTMIFDFEDLDSPSLDFIYEGTTGATDHNGYVVGDKFYLANNGAGLRVMDISDIANGNMEQVGFFDTYGSDNNPGFTGSWNVYPFFESGNIVISDRAEGFVLVRPTEPVAGIEDADALLGASIYPNPTSDLLRVETSISQLNSIVLTDLAGRIVLEEDNLDTMRYQLDLSSMPSGMYLLTLNNAVTKRVIKN